jgi:hypothetical protein
MKAKEFKAGVRVALGVEELPIKWGNVIALHLQATGVAIIEWDSGEISKQAISLLLSEEDGKRLENRLMTEQSNLEIEFLNAADEIRAKLKEAASLIERSSTLLGGQEMLKRLDDGGVYFDELNTLKYAIQDLPGWSSSSWSC